MPLARFRGDKFALFSPHDPLSHDNRGRATEDPLVHVPLKEQVGKEVEPWRQTHGQPGCSGGPFYLQAAASP